MRTFAQECLELRTLQFAPGADLDGRGIDRNIVDPDLIMQMRTCGQAGHPNIGHDLALRDTRTRARVRREAREMRIGRRIAAGMIDDEEVSIFAGSAGEFYRAA